MAERFSEMENSSVPSKATLEERLKEYPKLKAKIETMLGINENACAKEPRISRPGGRKSKTG